MLKDSRYRKFIGSISVVLLILAAQILTSVFMGEHLFGIQHKKQLIDLWGFNTQDPWRLYGLTFVTSYFLHIGWLHLAQDVIFLLFFSMMLEPKVGTLRVILFPVVVHIASLVLLNIVLFGEHIFLGSSLGGLSLFVYYCLKNKKPILLSMGIVLLVGYNIYSTGDIYSNLSHIFAILISSVLFSVSKYGFSRTKKA